MVLTILDIKGYTFLYQEGIILAKKKHMEERA